MKKLFPAQFLSAATAIVTALLLGSAARDAAAEASPMKPEQARWSEVRKDDLHEAIDRKDLQIVVLLPLDGCTRPAVGNLGIVRQWHCAGLMRLPTVPEMSSLNLTVAADDVATASVGETVQHLEAQGLPTSARFVLLVDWQVALREAGGSYYHMALATESALFDRRDQRWRWQAVHRYERYTGEKLSPESVLSDLASHLQRVVLPPVLDRPRTLAPSERYGIAWVAPEQALQAPAADRARVVLFNDYSKIGRSNEYDADRFTLMADADVVDANSRYQPPAVALLVGTRSYVAFDLNPADYTLFMGVDDRKALKLKGGQAQFIRYSRGMLNRNVLDDLSASDAAELQAKGKHAMLQDSSTPKFQHTPVRFSKD